MSVKFYSYQDCWVLINNNRNNDGFVGTDGQEINKTNKRDWAERFFNLYSAFVFCRRLFLLLFFFVAFVVVIWVSYRESREKVGKIISIITSLSSDFTGLLSELTTRKYNEPKTIRRPSARNKDECNNIIKWVFCLKLVLPLEFYPFNYKAYDCYSDF